jgi:signal transduction histidine kinase
MFDRDSGTIVVERARLQAGQRQLSAGAAAGVALFIATVVAGQVPPYLLFAWLLPSLAAVAAASIGSRAFERANRADAAAVDRLQHLSAALLGLTSGAAATLFLPLLDLPERLAITLAACAGLCAAIVEVGRHGRPFRLQAACCIGQFALAWWRLSEAGAGLVAASLAGFAALAALASGSVERLGRQVLAVAIENRHLAESLSVEHARAVAADRAKTHFVAAASHDLRQPAAALSLMTNLLREQARDPALAPLVNGLERSVASMNDLLGQLLDLSRLDTGLIAVESRPVDIDALLDELAAELAPQLAEKRLALHVRHSGRVLDCDPVLVTRMLRNLADNALRHTREGSITLAAEAGSTIRLSVSDTGTGIAAEHQQRIFEAHYQVGNASRQRAQGLGLGLAIVHRIAELHSVTVTLESSPGQGSRFILDFKTAEHRPLPGARQHGSESPDLETGGNGQPNSAVSFDKSPGQARFSGRRLLLVEDDETLALAFVAWFRAAGFETHHASDGIEALRILDGAEPLDAVVSDFRLPGDLDGLQVLEQARRLHPHGSRLLVSGDIDPRLAERARERGVPLLRKPVDPLQLQAHLAAALERVG